MGSHHRLLVEYQWVVALPLPSVLLLVDFLLVVALAVGVLVVEEEEWVLLTLVKGFLVSRRWVVVLVASLWKRVV